MARELAIDRIRCDGHGLCAELLPELITLDDWGYPIIARGPVPEHLAGHAQRAVAGCPVLALALRRPAAGAVSGPARTPPAFAAPTPRRRDG